MEEQEKNVVKKIPTGMVEFTFGKPHGTRKKDEVVVMHNSTAKALTAHKLGEVTKTITVLRKDNVE